MNLSSIILTLSIKFSLIENVAIKMPYEITRVLRECSARILLVPDWEFSSLTFVHKIGDIRVTGKRSDGKFLRVKHNLITSLHSICISVVWWQVFG